MKALNFHLTFFSIIFFSIQAISQSSLSVTILDENKDPTPVRVRVVDTIGNVVGLPAEVISIMYGRDDRPERYSYQPDSSFYVDGYFRMDLQPGAHTISLSKGIEYLDQDYEVLLDKN